MTHRPATTDLDIHPLIAGRWSTRAYADKPVDHAKVVNILEAARWAPSAFNAQPWRFVVFEKSGDAAAFARAFGTLAPFNQGWNTNAQVLVAVLTDTLNAKGEPNANAAHDAGAAAMALLLQAHAEGLAAHTMSGIDADAFRAEFAIPERFKVLSVISIAYHGDQQTLPAALLEREQGPRARLPLETIAQFGGWQTAG